MMSAKSAAARRFAFNDGLRADSNAGRVGRSLDRLYSIFIIWLADLSLYLPLRIFTLHTNMSAQLN